jgi:DNA-binding transcriptional ArsR family regulator
MSVNRRAVFERLAATSDAARRETTTVTALATGLGAAERAVDAHLDGLVACELARRYPDGRVRITRTGEELLDLRPDRGLDLDADDLVIVDPSRERPED